MMYRNFNTWTVVNSFTKIFLPRLWRSVWYRNTVEDRLLAYIKKTATEGDAASVLAAVDKFNQEEEWVMNIECDKREKIDEVLKERAPMACLELGTYCGYSAIVTKLQLPEGSRLITVEIDDKTADVARQMIQYAGLDQVTVVTGKSGDVILNLRSQYSVDKLDFVFMDHGKGQYLPDLRLLEENGLLHEGTVIVTDNTLFPGAPDYLNYVETSDRYKTERFYCAMDIFNVQDAMAISVCAGNN